MEIKVDSDVIAWKKKHKKCVSCKYLDDYKKCNDGSVIGYYCVAKSKKISNFWMWRRTFCKLFVLDLEDK